MPLVSRHRTGVALMVDLKTVEDSRDLVARADHRDQWLLRTSTGVKSSIAMETDRARVVQRIGINCVEPA